jgi:pimeloyl-ACP methyl ester carboxylesterase
MQDSLTNDWLEPAWRPPAYSRATIVFVHGAIVRGWEMAPLRARLRQLGYGTRQFVYRSLTRGLDENVARLGDFLAASEGDTIHVVGHSMGGVLLRRLFETQPDPRPGRLVAIGSPFLDCWVGRRFDRVHPWIGPLLIGRTVKDHISRPIDSKWRGSRDIGILAGTYPFGIGAVFQSHPRPSDGVVLLEETRLVGATDHLAIRLNHFGMLFSKRCTALIARFLATGRFSDSSRQAEGLAEAREVA